MHSAQDRKPKISNKTKKMLSDGFNMYLSICARTHTHTKSGFMNRKFVRGHD